MRKYGLYLVPIILIAVCVGLLYRNYDMLIAEQQVIIATLTTAAEGEGLENVSISLYRTPNYKDGYTAIIESANFGDLSFEDMIQTDVVISKKRSAEVLFGSYTSNGDTYKVFSSASGESIYKNQSQIYSKVVPTSKPTTPSSAYASSSGGTSVTDGNELGACWALAKQRVSADLKAPSTAKFPPTYSSPGVSITKSGNTYTVKGWVDAQNSFGSMLRNNFTVVMELSGSGSSAKFTTKSCSVY